MKTGRTLAEVAAELDRQKSAKIDFIAPTNQVAVEVVEGEIVEDKPQQKPAKSLVLRAGDHAYGVRDLALGQIGDRLGIPSKYLRKMQEERPDLLATNINTWFNHKSEPRLFRVLDDKVRAFLSNRYQRIDNFDVAQSALEALSKYQVEVRSTEVTENRLYIKATFPALQREIKSLRSGTPSPHSKGVKVGDIVEAGVVISNSEVGQGRVSITPFAAYLWCLNGATTQKGHNWTHVGSKIEGDDIAYLTDETVKAGDRFDLLRIRDAIAGTLDEGKFDQYIQKVQGATAEQIAAASVTKGIEVLSQKLSLTKDEGNSVLAHLIQGGDLSRYGLFNAVTRTAEDAVSYDRATELESLGHAVLELPANDWKQVAEAA